MRFGFIARSDDMNLPPATIRTRRFKLALLTSFAGKGVSVVVQLAALPLAVAALGQERFGVYAMLAAFLNWMSIVSVTIGPGLTTQLVRAHARMDLDQEKKIFASGLTLLTLFACLLYCATEIALHLLGNARIFGSSSGQYTTELASGINILGIFVASNIMLSVAEAAQAGYQKQYIHNLFLVVGNVITIVGISLLLRSTPTIAKMIAAVYVGPVVARGLSLAQLLATHRYLIQGMLRIDIPSVRLMARTGAAFVLTSVASFCYQSFTVYWIGRTMGPQAATQMSVFITILTVIGSLLLMVTQPLWPAIQDAMVRNDPEWVTKTYSRFTKYLMACVALAAGIIAVAGDEIVHIWIRSAITTTVASQCFLGLYFFLLAWEQFNYSFLIGMGRFWFASISYFFGAIVMLTNSSWLVTKFGISGMLAAMCSGPLFVTAWTYPLQLRRLFLRPHADLAQPRRGGSINN
jgi:O-antigen/teichoic acid export membrane protein